MNDAAISELDTDLLSRWITPHARDGFADLFFEWKRETSLKIENGEIRSATSVWESGVAARAHRGNRVVLTVNSRADEAGARDAVRRLANLLPSSQYPKSTAETAHLTAAEEPEIARWSRKLAGTLTRMFAGRTFHVHVRRCDLSRLIVAAGHPPLRYHRILLSLEGRLLADTRGGPRWRDFHFHIPAADDGALEEIRRRLRPLTEPGPAPLTPVAGSADILFDGGTAAILFHEIVSHPLEADAPSSSLSGLTRAKVAPRELEVADIPSRLDLFGGYPADDEAVPGRRTALIAGGHLGGPLRDQVHSDPLHPPTGNGRRAGPFAHACPRGSNIVIGAGGASDEEMERRLFNGIRVVELLGGAVDPAAGVFQVRFSSARSVVRGRAAQTLSGGVIEGKILEALAAVDPLLGGQAIACRQLGWCCRDGKILPVGGEAPGLIVRRLHVRSQ